MTATRDPHTTTTTITGAMTRPTRNLSTNSSKNTSRKKQNSNNNDTEGEEEGASGIVLASTVAGMAWVKSLTFAVPSWKQNRALVYPQGCFVTAASV